MRSCCCVFPKSGVEAQYVDPKQAGLIVKDEDGHTVVLPELMKITRITR